MDVSFLLKGFLLGLSIAAPVGPVGALCIRRTLAEGRIVGLVSGLGAATADGIYGAIAGFGLTVISSLLISQQGWLKLIGGLFLFYLGGKIFLSKPSTEAAAVTGKGLIGAYTSTLFLTLTNPITILSFTLVFSSLGLNTSAAEHDFGSAALLVIGVPLGSAVWWLLLSAGVSRFQSRFTPTAMQWVNRLAGVLIIAFGAASLYSLLTTI
jgi:threonine/homoserine/homoserine lactone efflux protein